MPVDPSKVSGLMPAAGAGSRLGLGPKALLEIGGKSLLRGLVDKLLRVADEVIIAVPAGREGEFAAAYPDCRCIPGGASRQDSVRRLAEASTHGWTILHDAARPFASEALLRNVADAARQSGCAGAFLDPEVPVARLSEGLAVEALARGQAGIFQAPQAFAREILLDLVRRADAHAWQEQSTMQLALRAGITVRAVAGEKTNIKLTTIEDWNMARHLAGLSQ